MVKKDAKKITTWLLILTTVYFSITKTCFIDENKIF
tara:strand:+ start:4746 stop:4853 length:108 start_codon:yes stop_codon:yes gene_type:complete